MKTRISTFVLTLGLCTVAGVSAGAAQDLARCERADRLLSYEFGMETRVDSDTLDDWRTGKRLEVCQITAAGVRRTTLQTTAREFYEKVREAGWTRTPDPRDAPNEASLRFRMAETDCLFNVYQGILLGTESEIAVSNALVRQRGEDMYHVLVRCMPAMEARPRG